LVARTLLKEGEEQWQLGAMGSDPSKEYELIRKQLIQEGQLLPK
jgi:hypothetical protein